MTREEAQKDFKEKLSNLLKEYKKNIGEEIELRFAFFDDDLGKYYHWEGDGFEYEEDIDILVNERNHEDERFDLGKNIVHIHKNMGDWVKIKKDEIGLKILDK